MFSLKFFMACYRVCRKPQRRKMKFAHLFFSPFPPNVTSHVKLLRQCTKIVFISHHFPFTLRDREFFFLFVSSYSCLLASLTTCRLSACQCNNNFYPHAGAFEAFRVSPRLLTVQLILIRKAWWDGKQKKISINFCGSYNYWITKGSGTFIRFH